uniref:Homeobox domain-containing protein n=1 Tax=Pipistrellus kuhlii TaxID=59472 RepID=A0A7J7ZJL0_PIPKU|nr:hypothetical protein mPipKuh1_009491 [Pipistrellus kuhlii]
MSGQHLLSFQIATPGSWPKAQDSSLDRVNGRRSRTRFTEDQVKILIHAFSENPYPGYTTIQKLALEIDANESRIQTWFQNRRQRHLAQRRSEAEEDVDANQDQDRKQRCFSLKMRSRPRQPRITYTPFQVHSLLRAFEENSYPGIGSGEQLVRKLRFQFTFGFIIKGIEKSGP